MDPQIKNQILEQGMSLEDAQVQISNFQSGFPFLPIVSAAKIGDGIRQLTPEEIFNYGQTYGGKASKIEIVKFVPASGAASRMFKDLFAFLDGDGDLEKSPFTKKFIDQINKFAFYGDLQEVLKKKGSSIENALESKNYKEIVAALLDEEGLGYGVLPKGLLKFHQYKDHNRTPTYEHFIEGIMYAVGKDNTVRLHFTVSPEHESKFKEEVSRIQNPLEEQFKVKFEISYSQQKKSTDTIAVDMDNNPFVEEDGTILFRPAGHGALLENLNEINGDLIFIKNIDNVVPDRLKDATKNYKIAIGSLLLEIQEIVFEALEKLENDYSDHNIASGESAIIEILGGKLPEDYSNFDSKEKGRFLYQKLNRPIRVCGMVKNTGEPGGGPFWVQDKNGSLSLQIAETAQIDLDDSLQKEIMQSSTHFNPVDLVCAIKDYKGKKFNLLEFRDMKTGFVTEKSKSGRTLKAQELPGLWNGAMAGWNTIFVEVPLITFNPVKTVNDLLRDEHQ
ncbi:DUF4301 family protein [Belliella sp. DSM 107340]|uniref:DUF4301 family protein n=1 Tax=Belliella calami TaxID=2923436 RepID=A0ABS9URC8_9BACT|nr:DUF4301 family protein [Belliella calami]MCH7399192.1 DUF4301 family protein [Belliella calami]